MPGSLPRDSRSDAPVEVGSRHQFGLVQICVGSIERFAKVEGQINTVEAKLEGKIDKLDERTKLGFWGFIFRGTALAVLAALTAIFVKYLFPILPTELPKY